MRQRAASWLAAKPSLRLALSVGVIPSERDWAVEIGDLRKHKRGKPADPE
ncbi:hypothetical protein HG421_17265 [Xanthomonas campestris pv. badrii]|uniref:Uncharacterized protein n=1 Tax=Xanthomonas campestris pv. badrii TaxID=149696 RepID=A0A7Z2VCU1_XANCA|nr:hypothetical protein [Xanthomonas campestris]MCC4603435.1 hypothetical protein [Xanthomonas campestris pv. parthenii]QJD69281.1 hypothetical protein HG421_17265 [Xanthomonas campestris pv. badrii]